MKRTAERDTLRSLWLWVPIGLSAAGIGISAYLVGKRFTGGALACTRWAQCDVVNNSVYAVMYGVPVSVIGLAGYLLLLGVSVAAVRTVGPTQRGLLALSLLLSLGGVGFSIYLTYLEIYVIQALCAWCVASAIIIVLLALLSALNLRRAGRTATASR
jgi:uncharacterized membrane protein